MNSQLDSRDIIAWYPVLSIDASSGALCVTLQHDNLRRERGSSAMTPDEDFLCAVSSEAARFCEFVTTRNSNSATLETVRQILSTPSHSGASPKTAATLESGSESEQQRASSALASGSLARLCRATFPTFLRNADTRGAAVLILDHEDEARAFRHGPRAFTEKWLEEHPEYAEDMLSPLWMAGSLSVCPRGREGDELRDEREALLPRAEEERDGEEEEGVMSRWERVVGESYVWWF